MLWSKLGLTFGKKGRHGKEDVNSLTDKSNVNEEYKEAFRTKSYIEICNKVQGQLEIRTTLNEGQSSSSSSSSLSSSSSSSSSLPHTPPMNVNLSEYLLEPRQETLASFIDSSNLNQYLINYFQISLEAGIICESLLTKTRQVHINYRSVKNIIKLIRRVPDNTNWTHNQYHGVYKNLALVASYRNPFSKMTPEKFNELHKSYQLLLRELTSQCRKTKRRTKFIRCIKMVMGTFLIVGCGALTIALLILAMHSMVGMVAAPGLIVCTLGLYFTKKVKRAQRKFNRAWLEGLGEQLDIAARGVYILINDFDTMSRLIKRLNDEMEHRKFVADICVKKGKNEMMKEVVKEFQMHESYFLEQLEELEKQIYLCFLDINRSRRLVVQEMVK
ncbi:hypothetical protein RD792_006582 [Penstemon davidsonii]|uniref:Uncharacterized protein n=1 Tax=Penstemon davidsonii TaxID=160366 RepID=A0ABR0DC89_9LAMI|nr:hypothetical protein RD792_006582 [Penstemon davidsonii]